MHPVAFYLNMQAILSKSSKEAALDGWVNEIITKSENQCTFIGANRTFNMLTCRNCKESMEDIDIRFINIINNDIANIGNRTCLSQSRLSVYIAHSNVF